MAMTNNGLSKLTEEIGELGQVIGKMLQYPELQMDATRFHPDGTNLRLRLEDEMADVCAAIRFAMVKLDLDVTRIYSRQVEKESKFNKWDSGDDKAPSTSARCPRCRSPVSDIEYHERIRPTGMCHLCSEGAAA